jgi:Protein of unknown function (DUF2844)
MRIVGIRTGKLIIGGFLIACVLAAGTVPASAGLGGDEASVESDASAMVGKMLQPPSTQDQEQSDIYSKKSFVAGNGVTVREYSARSGPVFGVAWQGHRPPDLSVLLGSYYPEYAAAVAAHQGQIGLHHSVIATPDSMVFLSGHMGNLTGRAYVPNLVPPGIDAKAVVK